MADVLADSGLEPNQATNLVFNCQIGRVYDSIRDFLAVHYRFNRRLNTPFWRECQAKVELHGAQRVVDFYRENGPSGLWRNVIYEELDAREFGTEGYLAMLVGQAVPYSSPYKPTPQDRQSWASVKQWIRSRVATAFTVGEAMRLVRSESWIWPERLYNRSNTLRR